MEVKERLYAFNKHKSLSVRPFTKEGRRLKAEWDKMTPAQRECWNFNFDNYLTANEEVA